jgi:anti-anti-sigma factor
MLKVYRQRLGDIAVLRLCGGLLIGQTQDLESAVLNEWGVNTVFLDLASVNRIDARGLGVLLELREYVQARGSDFQLTNVTGPVRRVFEIARLDCVFEIVSENKVYLSSLSGKIDTGEPVQSVSKLDADTNASFSEELVA